MASFDLASYVDVQERINKFWEENPHGAINTEAIYARDFDSIVILASVYKNLDDPRPSATGIAAEERGADYKAGANFTSWHENAETSAIGRALVNMAYAKSNKDRPSRQEMEKVVRHGGQPVERTQTVRQTSSATPTRNGHTNGASPASLPGNPVGPTEKQGKLIFAVSRNLNLTDQDVHELAGVNESLKELSIDGVKALIDKLKAMELGETPPTHADLQRGDGEIVDWGQFWGPARKAGITTRQEFETFVGVAMPQHPQQALDILNSKMKG